MKSTAFALTFILMAGAALADEPSSSTAEDKAQELHRLASSDVVYQDQEIKALYYQNVQMIELLKQIRDLIDSRLKEKTDSKPE